MPYIKPDSEIEFIFHDELSNETIIMYGELDGPLMAKNSNGSIPIATIKQIVSESDNYDSTGALTYVIAVIVVYGISMFLIVATLLRRKSSHKSLDGQVDRYIKGLEAARVQAKMESVLRTRLRWPGNFIHFGTGDTDQDSNTNSDSETDNDDASDQSYVELPATTAKQKEPDNICHESSTHSESFDPISIIDIPEYMRRSRRHRTRTNSRGDSGKKGKKDSRRKRSEWRASDINSQDGDSYVELPATTLKNKFEGSLAIQGGQKVVVVEDDIRGGVEVIPNEEVPRCDSLTSLNEADYQETDQCQEITCNGADVENQTPSPQHSTNSIPVQQVSIAVPEMSHPMPCTVPQRQRRAGMCSGDTYSINMDANRNYEDV